MENKHLLSPRLSRRDALRATGAAALVTLFPRELLAGPVEACQAFLGSFVHAGGAKEREALDSAIEEVVAGMNILVRPIARDRLKGSNVIAQAGQISCDGKALTVVVDKRSYTAPVDGRSVKVVVSGDELDLKYRVSDGSIEQTFSAEDSGRVNTLSLHDRDLVMRVRVYSNQLPKDLKYKLTYRRS